MERMELAPHFAQFNGSMEIHLNDAATSGIQWRYDLDMQVDIRPESKGGVIFHSSGMVHGDSADKGPFFHSLELEGGAVKYRYDVGRGEGEVL